MFERWQQRQAQAPILSPSATISLIVHATLVGCWVAATHAPVPFNPDSPLARAFYIPPPDRVIAQQGQRETLRFVEIAVPGEGSGAGPAVLEPATEVELGPPSPAGDRGTAEGATPAAPEIAGEDSVFTVLEVDTEVVRLEGSAAPAYPAALLERGVEGSVATQYVVDTSGFADPASLRVLRASHPDFIAAVRAALPYMRFSPARVGERAVRQVVEQEFVFRIQAPPPPEPRRPGSAR
jgi:periplasmic protein TonB